MLDRLASGGIITVLLITALALGYNKVLIGPKWAIKAIPALAIVVIFGALLLPEKSAFHAAIKGDLLFIFWALIWASPIIIYGVLIFFIRKKTREREMKNDP